MGTDSQGDRTGRAGRTAGPALSCVLTTINGPTACARRLGEVLRRHGARLLVFGDRKGPADFTLDGADFYPLARQRRLPFRLARLLPEGHYTRKNLGYLQALADGARCVYETDDDNMPNDHWAPRAEVTTARAAAPRPWCNVYRFFSDQLIWPRGFPLERIRDRATYEPAPSGEAGTFRAPVQQGLADLAPDVDAVWRMVVGADFHFARRPSVWLPPGTWCPFNSQTTWWWPDAYPLLYLPSRCSFRMTDIWRGFVAQRCLWARGLGLVFHAAEAVQERNEHCLHKDFLDEVPGYEHNARLSRTLDAVPLSADLARTPDNLHACYRALVAAGILPADEMPLLEAWLRDLEDLRATAPAAA